MAQMFEINVAGGVPAHAYLPQMSERGWGRIVFVSSRSAFRIPVEVDPAGSTRRPISYAISAQELPKTLVD